MSGLEERAVQNVKKAAQCKRLRKWLIAAAIILALGAGLLAVRGGKSVTPTISPTDMAKLVRCDLQDSISATGTVESAKSMTVYSTKAYTVQEIFVEVGDRVEEGQLLCKLDDQNIQNQIESQQASLDASTNSSNAAITTASDNYQQFKQSLEEGTNASIISAENAVNNAWNAYQAAQETYERYVDGLEAGENTTILAQEAALNNARKAARNAYDAYEKALDAAETAEAAYDEAAADLADAEAALAAAEAERSELATQSTELETALQELKSEQQQLQQQLDADTQSGENAQLQIRLEQVAAEIGEKEASLLALQTQLAQAESACSSAAGAVTQYSSALAQHETACNAADEKLEACAEAIDTAEDNLETVQKQYQAAVTGADNLLEDYATNVDNTYQAYQTAEASLRAAQTSAQNQLQTYENSLNSAYANAGKGTLEVSLRQLKTELEGTQITSPMTGTVTAVYAEVGAAGTGLLFVIEDTENFVIATSVKDYDIAAVGVGTKAAIRSDATGDDVYAGEVTYLAPTANKTSMGVTDTSGDISFAADVKVTDKDTRLRIGLKVRMDLIAAEEKDALAAPYDAIYQNADGHSCVMLAQQQEDGSYLLREVPVELGLETDLEISVKSDELTEADAVICSPEQYLDWLGQSVTVGAISRPGLMGGK